MRNKVDITQEFGNAPAPVPGSSKLGSVSQFTYSSVPNRRLGQNKHADGKILKKHQTCRPK